MKLLITGGAGYIGTVLLETLLNPDTQEDPKYQFQEDLEIVVIDNLHYQQTSLVSLLRKKNIQFIYGDVRDKEFVHKWVKWCDVVLPLACIVGMPACNKEKYNNYQKVNFSHIVDCALWSREYNKKMVYFCTNSGYGVGDVVDGELAYCTEESTLSPLSGYGIWKVNAEVFCLEQAPENVVCFRLATVFGLSPRMRLDLLVNDFVYKAVTEGSITLFEPHFKRNYVHIKDVVRSFIFAINNFDKMKGETYNMGLSSANLSKFELCQKIKEQVPELKTFHIEGKKDIDKRNYIVSNEKLESLGWEPKYSIEDGIEELIKGYEVLTQVRSLWGNV